MARRVRKGFATNAHVAFRTAYELLGNLERVRNRRKALILISDGYDFDPFPAGRTGTDQVFGGRYGTPGWTRESGDGSWRSSRANNQFADADLASELAAVTGVANRVNASIYAIDPRGVAGTTSAAEQSRHDRDADPHRQDPEQPAGAGRSDRRLCRGQRQHLRRGAQAHRRGDQRLLHPRLLLDQQRYHSTKPTGRGEGGTARRTGRVARLVSHQGPDPDRRPGDDRLGEARAPRCAVWPALGAAGRWPGRADRRRNRAARAASRLPDLRDRRLLSGISRRRRRAPQLRIRRGQRRLSSGRRRSIRVSRWPTGARR